MKLQIALDDVTLEQALALLEQVKDDVDIVCLLYTSPSPRDA